MGIYERIYNKVCEIFYNMKKIKSNGRSPSKLELESMRFTYMRPGLGRHLTVEDLNGYCKLPEIKEGVKNLSKYNFFEKK